MLIFEIMPCRKWLHRRHPGQQLKVKRTGYRFSFVTCSKHIHHPLHNKCRSHTTQRAACDVKCGVTAEVHTSWFSQLVRKYGEIILNIEQFTPEWIRLSGEQYTVNTWIYLRCSRTTCNKFDRYVGMTSKSYHGCERDRSDSLWN